MDAIDLILSLCSWDPSRRPRAADVLQHPFFQACYYVPPSLRPRVTGLPNTPSVATKCSMETKSTGRYSTGVLSNSKVHSNINILPTDVQRNLEMAKQDSETNDRQIKNLKQSTYRPPVRNNPGYMKRNTRRVSDVVMTPMSNAGKVSDLADKLAKMKMSMSAQLPPGRPPPSSMKSGWWYRQIDYLGQSYEVP